jgi:hypothetical protein
MDFILTDHAKRRCARRRIQIEWIERALERPARLESDREDQTLLHALYQVPERSFRVLRVIYNETLDRPVVVTAYFDDQVTDL